MFCEVTGLVARTALFLPVPGVPKCSGLGIWCVCVCAGICTVFVKQLCVVSYPLLGATDMYILRLPLQ